MEFGLCGWGFITRTALRFRLYETQYSNPTRVLGKYEDIPSDAIQIPGTIVSACPGSGYIVCGAVNEKALTRCVTSQPHKLLVHNAARLATSVDQETASPCECNSVIGMRLCTVCMLLCSVRPPRALSIPSKISLGSVGHNLFGMSARTKLNICMWEAMTDGILSQEV